MQKAAVFKLTQHLMHVNTNQSDTCIALITPLVVSKYQQL